MSGNVWECMGSRVNSRVPRAVWGRLLAQARGPVEGAEKRGVYMYLRMDTAGGSLHVTR